MGSLDNRFHRRERKSRRNYAIDDSIFEEFAKFSSIYEASLSDLLNVAIAQLVEREEVILYTRKEKEISIVHTFAVWESNLIGLEYLRSRYGVSIFTLVNIALRNAVMKESQKRLE